VAASTIPISAATEDLPTKELKELTKFIDESFGRQLGEIAALKATRKISMEYLWSIFRPGEMVLLQKCGPGGRLETACGTLQYYYTKKTREGTPVWCLKIRHMSFEGGRFGVVETDYTFPQFPGQMEIPNLPAFPLKYYPNLKHIKHALSTQGKKYIQLCVNNKGKNFPVHMTYHGPVWIQRKEQWKAEGCDFFDAPERMVRHFHAYNLQ